VSLNLVGDDHKNKQYVMGYEMPRLTITAVSQEWCGVRKYGTWGTWDTRSLQFICSVLYNHHKLFLVAMVCVEHKKNDTLFQRLGP
jgi:hypothetical protein